MRAAKYLGVAPWDLLQQPAIWLVWALRAERAEADAAEDQRRAQAE
jgi:hypothetical protein